MLLKVLRRFQQGDRGDERQLEVWPELLQLLQ